MITLEFLVTSLIVALIPGTGVLFTISVGLAQGRRAAFFAALGCTAGIVPHLLATVLGLAALLHTSALAFQALKIAGVAYLFYLAFVTWKDRQGFAPTTQAAAQTAGALMLRAVALNLLNPKLTLFFLAFLPQFIAPSVQNKTLAFAMLGLIFTVNALPITALYVLAADRMRSSRWAARGMQWLDKLAGVLFIGFGLRLALTARPTP